MDNCIFCKIVSNEFDSYKLYEDNDFIVILDKFPATIGHCLVIPKEHSDDLFDMSEDLASKALVIAQKIGKAIKNVTGCSGINILQNNGKSAGQVVFHYHLHIIPRYENDDVVIKLNANELENAVEFIEKIKNKLEA